MSNINRANTWNGGKCNHTATMKNKAKHNKAKQRKPNESSANKEQKCIAQQYKPFRVKQAKAWNRQHKRKQRNLRHHIKRKNMFANGSEQSINQDYDLYFNIKRLVCIHDV